VSAYTAGATPVHGTPPQRKRIFPKHPNVVLPLMNITTTPRGESGSGRTPSRSLRLADDVLIHSRDSFKSFARGRRITRDARCVIREFEVMGRWKEEQEGIFWVNPAACSCGSYIRPRCVSCALENAVLMKLNTPPSVQQCSRRYCTSTRSDGNPCVSGCMNLHGIGIRGDPAPSRVGNITR
jgi:hypothetical protein